MGWDQKDAVGEPLREGDHVKVFRNFAKSVECAHVVGKVGVVGNIEFPHYAGRLHVRVRFPDDLNIWVHHMSVMIV